MNIKKVGTFRFKFFRYVGNTPIIPIKINILAVFVILILLSAFSTNLISIMLSQRKTMELSNTVMIDKLAVLYNVCNSQKQIESYSQDTESCIQSIYESAMIGFSDREENSVAFGVKEDGSFLFIASPKEDFNWEKFDDEDAFNVMENSESGQGRIDFKTSDGDDYFGVYKYHPDWQAYIVRANQKAESNRAMFHVIGLTVGIIILLVLFFVFMGMKILEGLLANINSFSEQMYSMQKNKELAPLKIDGAPNDDITYLASNFNNLSSTINNLLQIFQKFVPENVVRKAHLEQDIKLEGKQRELTILFSDIKSFTYRTEVLGNDIIGLLNVHYESVIRKVSENRGIIGSIIGDAILASYGIEEDHLGTKSLDAIKSAWEITAVTAELRGKMARQRSELEKTRPLTESEEKMYKAIMLDVGVGIDGGNVFYGNIGSSRRMANTVIGDNVNSASRLEGLTRIYRVPVIVSQYIRDEALGDSEACERYSFYELDTVQVKGKTEGVKIYFPLDRYCPATEWDYGTYSQKLEVFEKGLAEYYAGRWNEARTWFRKANFALCDVFLERMGFGDAPENWSGIWAMTTK